SAHDALVIVHGGQDLPVPGGTERAQGVGVPGRAGQEPIRPVGGYPQIADDAELTGPRIAYDHASLQRAGWPGHSVARVTVDQAVACRGAQFWLWRNR